MNVSLLITCLADALFPEVGVATVHLLRRLGLTVAFPPGQTCCGQPFFNSGYHADARDLARHTIRTFDHGQIVVTPSGSCAAMVKLEYPELEVVLTFPDPFPKVYADPDKVVQVLTNLVENACKYGSPSGMRVQGQIGDEDVAVAVSDRGEGIPEEDLPKVFTKFFRRAEGKPTGSGLGLWISRGLVEAHGGRLIASSIPGQGTTFRFTLPLIAFEELHG